MIILSHETMVVINLFVHALTHYVSKGDPESTSVPHDANAESRLESFILLMVQWGHGLLVGVIIVLTIQ